MAHEQLVKKWETTLTRDGRPAELPFNHLVSPTLGKKLERAHASYMNDYGAEPRCLEDILPDIEPLSKNQLRALGQFGLEVALSPQEWASIEADAPAVEETVAQCDFADKFAILIDGVLTQQEATIVRLHYGIGAEQPLKIKEICELYEGIAPSRVGQILTAARKKMRDSDLFELVQ